jgi:hypothetical protein|tara:strand:+ start:216 stop:389 length:174 start_codon:yes stop_codon:yes gene_type:complete
MKTFKQFKEQITPSPGGVAVPGSDGKIRRFMPPLDLRSVDQKMKNVKNQVRAKFGKP